MKTRERQSYNPESVEGEFVPVVVDDELLPDVVGGVLQEVREHNLPHRPHLQGNTGQVFTGFKTFIYFLGRGCK